MLTHDHQALLKVGAEGVYHPQQSLSVTLGFIHAAWLSCNTLTGAVTAMVVPKGASNFSRPIRSTSGLCGSKRFIITLPLANRYVPFQSHPQFTLAKSVLAPHSYLHVALVPVDKQDINLQSDPVGE